MLLDLLLYVFVLICQSTAGRFSHIISYAPDNGGHIVQVQNIRGPDYFLPGQDIHRPPIGELTSFADSLDSSKILPPQSNVHSRSLSMPSSHGDAMQHHGDEMQSKAEAIASAIFRSNYEGEYGPYGFAPQNSKQCYQPSASQQYNLSYAMYDYPQRAIYSELYQRPNVLQAIYNSRKDNLKSSKQTLGGSSCSEQVSVLEGFSLNRGQCWVLYPRHQNIQYVTCSYPTCTGTGKPRCSTNDVIKSVWAWCDVLPYGQKIVKVDIPLPVSCQCGSYSC